MANFNFNKAIVGGRLTSDVELKQTENGVSIVRGNIAVNRRVKDKDGKPITDFFNFTAFRGTAELISKYFSKGSSICVVGEINNNTWTDKQGGRRYSIDIVVDEVHFVGTKAEGVSGTPAEFTDANGDDDLPF